MTPDEIIKLFGLEPHPAEELMRQKFPDIKPMLDECIKPNIRKKTEK